MPLTHVYFLYIAVGKKKSLIAMSDVRTSRADNSVANEEMFSSEIISRLTYFLWANSVVVVTVLFGQEVVGSYRFTAVC